MKKLALSVSSLALMAFGAQAADLPLAEPVEYVKVCDTYGKGFFYIPGTDTCLKIAGLVRFDARWEEETAEATQNALTTDVRGRLQFDARSETEWGTLRSFVEIEGRSAINAYPGGTESTALRQGYIQFAGITAGKLSRSFYDFVPGKHIGDFVSDEQVVSLGYTAKLTDGFTGTVAIEDKYFRALPQGATPLETADLDQEWPNIVANVNVKQAWGEFQVSGAVQDNEGDQAPRADDTGWAAQAGVAINLPSETKGSKIWVNGAYSEGALSYIGGEDFPGTKINEGYAQVTNFRDQNGGINSEGWAIAGGLNWFWTKEWNSNLAAVYSEIDQTGDEDIDFLLIEANTFWTPVAGLTLALAVQYSDLETSGVNTGTAATEGDHWGVVTRVERTF